MAQLSQVQMARAGFSDRRMAASSPEKYHPRCGDQHPRCGDQHRHKPAKALIGIGLLIVLSMLLYGITGKASEPPTSAPHHMGAGSR
ncbi:hypothetical protein [Tardiphaga sp.]|jgi:hypothetical protein|uniref:hypothetical protein n=1 Tax=Tardiphaga sp. TaxID=1926292 RepID=UPI0037DA4B0E